MSHREYLQRQIERAERDLETMQRKLDSFRRRLEEHEQEESGPPPGAGIIDLAGWRLRKAGRDGAGVALLAAFGFVSLFRNRPALASAVGGMAMITAGVVIGLSTPVTQQPPIAGPPSPPPVTVSPLPTPPPAVPRNPRPQRGERSADENQHRNPGPVQDSPRQTSDDQTRVFASETTDEQRTLQPGVANAADAEKPREQTSDDRRQAPRGEQPDGPSGTSPDPPEDREPPGGTTPRDNPPPDGEPPGDRPPPDDQPPGDGGGDEPPPRGGDGPPPPDDEPTPRDCLLRAEADLTVAELEAAVCP